MDAGSLCQYGYEEHGKTDGGRDAAEGPQPHAAEVWLSHDDQWERERGVRDR